jgi:hypothetical protein
MLTKKLIPKLGNVSKWLPCAEMAAIMSKSPRRFTASFRTIVLKSIRKLSKLVSETVSEITARTFVTPCLPYSCSNFIQNAEICVIYLSYRRQCRQWWLLTVVTVVADGDGDDSGEGVCPTHC